VSIDQPLHVDGTNGSGHGRRGGGKGEGGNGTAKKGRGGDGVASRHSDATVLVEIPVTDTTVTDTVTDVEDVLKRQPLRGTLNFPQLRPDLRKELFRSLLALTNTIVN
jgi:hypothetical protein